MTATRRVLCLCGSLRRVSSNRAALEAARELAGLDVWSPPGAPSLHDTSSPHDPLPPFDTASPFDTPSPQRLPTAEGLVKLGSSAFGGTEPKALDDSLRSPLRGQPSAVQGAQGPLLSCFRRNDGWVMLDLQLYDGMAALPLFNPDDEVGPLPAPVLALREAVGQADALLVACPEYAHGVPGAFKNLLDWLVGSLEFPGKPVLLLNASARGSYHAQEALAEILRTMSAALLTSAPVPVALPGAGCTVERVLADVERCAELRVALDILAEIPPHP